MSRGYQGLKVDEAAVKAAMSEAKTVDEFQRYQAIHLRVTEAMDVERIARLTGLAESTIHNLHSRCRRQGLEAVKAKHKGGRYRSYLSEEEEKKLLADMEPQARRGGILEVSKIHRALEEKVGGEVALFTTYRLLHRHGWRKIAPRPKHP
jgi:transposase